MTTIDHPGSAPTRTGRGRFRPAATGAGGLAARVNVSAGGWDVIWTFTHRVLVVNLGLALGNAPLLAALAVVHQPWRYPVFFGVLSLSLAPSVAAAFDYLHAAERDGRDRLADLALAWRRHARRAALRGAATLAVLGVLLADVLWLYDSAPGALLVPPLAVLALIVAATGVLSLALLALRPGLGLAAALRLCGYTAVRRCWLSAFSLVLLAVALAVVNQAPLLGLATVPGCVLVAVWSNSKVALSHLLAAPDPTGVGPFTG